MSKYMSRYTPMKYGYRPRNNPIINNRTKMYNVFWDVSNINDSDPIHVATVYGKYIKLHLYSKGMEKEEEMRIFSFNNWIEAIHMKDTYLYKEHRNGQKSIIFVCDFLSLVKESKKKKKLFYHDCRIANCEKNCTSFINNFFFKK